MTTRAYDPFTELIRTRLAQDAPKVQITATSRPRWLLRLESAFFLLRLYWISATYWALTGSLAAAGLLFLSSGLLGHQISGTGLLLGAADYASIAATAAASLAFSGAIFGAISVPITTTLQFGAGYSAELHQRKLLWIPGAACVALSGLLFAVAALSPNRDSALGSGLLAAAGFGLVWTVSRHALISGDPLHAAERQARFLRSAFLKKVAVTRSLMRRMLPKTHRSEDIVRKLNSKTELDDLAGMLRQLWEGIRGAQAKGLTWPAHTFWVAALDMFMDYSRSTGGAIGAPSGVTRVLFQVADSAVTQFAAVDSDLAAVRVIESVERACVLPIEGSDHAGFRSRALSFLRGTLMKHIASQTSEIPNVCVSTIAISSHGYIRLGAMEDWERNANALRGIALSSNHANLRHVMEPAVLGLVDALPLISGLSDAAVRNHYLRVWADGLVVVASLPRLSEPFHRPSDLLIPGAWLQSSGGLQLRLWESCALGRGEAEAALGATVRFLEETLVVIAGRPIAAEPLVSHVDDGLAALYSTALAAACYLHAGSEAAEDLANSIADLVVDTVRRTTSEEGCPLLRSDDSCELIWSLALVCGYLASDPQLTADTLRQIVPSELALSEARKASYFRMAFLRGCLITRDEPDDNIRELDKVWKSSPASRYATWGLRIEGVGRVPSLNVNRVSVPIPITGNPLRAVIKWAFVSFPSFSPPPPAPAHSAATQDDRPSPTSANRESAKETIQQTPGADAAQTGDDEAPNDHESEGNPGLHGEMDPRT